MPFDRTPPKLNDDLSEDAATVLFSGAAMADLLEESGILLDDMATDECDVVLPDEDIGDYDSLASQADGASPTATSPPALARVETSETLRRFPRPGPRPQQEPERSTPSWVPWAAGVGALVAAAAATYAWWVM